MIKYMIVAGMAILFFNGASSLADRVNPLGITESAAITFCKDHGGYKTYNNLNVFGDVIVCKDKTRRISNEKISAKCLAYISNKAPEDYVEAYNRIPVALSDEEYINQASYC